MRWRRSLCLLLAASAMLVGSGGAAAQWLPSSATPLRLQWLLSTPLDVNNPTHMGLRDFGGATLPYPDVYDIDGFDNPAGTVSYLHALGKPVICYISAGSWEDWRPDAASFPESVKGNNNGWPGEKWLDIRAVSTLEPIMRNRIAMCASKGFDAVEPDNIDGYTNSTGFPLTANDQLVYNRALAQWTHEAGLTAILKNDVEQVPDLVGSFDAALNEECYRYAECAGYSAFVSAGKAVWVAEYRKTRLSKCSSAALSRFNLSIFRLALDGPRQPCAAGW